MFTERQLPVTVFAVATAMARNPDAVAAMNEAGWEIASHGLKWIDYRDFTEDGRARRMSRKRSAFTPELPAPGRSVSTRGAPRHSPSTW